jgi:hypothetical protein
MQHGSKTYSDNILLFNYFLKSSDKLCLLIDTNNLLLIILYYIYFLF